MARRCGRGTQLSRHGESNGTTRQAAIAKNRSGTGTARTFSRPANAPTAPKRVGHSRKSAPIHSIGAVKRSIPARPTGFWKASSWRRAAPDRLNRSRRSIDSMKIVKPAQIDSDMVGVGEIHVAEACAPDDVGFVVAGSRVHRL